MKLLKLINNEYRSLSVNIVKGCVEDSCSVSDHAMCTVNATDTCKSDLAACSYHAIDKCFGNLDVTACTGYQQDITY